MLSANPCLLVQADGFASDSTRMISSIRRQNPQLQLLLFSATFNEDVKRFAQKVVGQDANQVRLFMKRATSIVGHVL